MPLIVLETLIVAPRERCFDLSIDVDVHQRSVADTGERVVGGVATGRMQLGDEVTWEARHLGRTRRLTSRITEYDRPNRFVDEMVQGPFTSFRHEHRFQVDPAGTRMTDRFDYRSPLGWLGRLADALFLKSYLKRLLETRNRYVKAAAEAPV